MEHFPILEFDPDFKAILNPEDRVKPTEIPEHCVLCFFNDEINKLNQKGVLKQIKKVKSEVGTHIIYTIEVKGERVVLFHPGVGAPLAAVFLEELIALGGRKFIVCGGAGVLDNSVDLGQLIIPTSAIRDEGTSYHYIKPSREVSPSLKAVQAIEDTLSHEGLDYLLAKTWTTDGLYRETEGKVRLRKSEGCLTVEMEAAALFAVAQFRKVDIGQILYAGDNLGGDHWQGRRWIHQTDLRNKLIRLSSEACLKL